MKTDRINFAVHLKPDPLCECEHLETGHGPDGKCQVIFASPPLPHSSVAPQGRCRCPAFRRKGAIPKMLSCFVRGIPAPKGSKKAFASGDRVVVVDANPKSLKDWQQAVMFVLQSAWQAAPLQGPVEVDISFGLLKPPSVPKKRAFPTVKPDIDKLARAILDALTGIVIRDDAQVVRLRCSKDYMLEAGAQIRCGELEAHQGKAEQ